jgi:hypothetical protein
MSQGNKSDLSVVTLLGVGVTWIGIGVVLILLAVALGLYIWNLGGPPVDTPEIVSELTGVKTICENRVRDLKGAGINGEAEYEKVQVEANKCIGYLKGVIASGNGDQEEIKSRLDLVSDKCGLPHGW